MKYLLLCIMFLLPLQAKSSLNFLCIDNQLLMKITSDKLNLTKEALADNTGGYVDIPFERFYLKIKEKVYKLEGEVKKDTKTQNNQFYSFVSLENKLLLDLKQDQKLKLIQKIDLEKNNQGNISQNTTTTNIVNIFFDFKIFLPIHQSCK